MWIDGVPYHYLKMRNTADCRPYIHPIGMFGLTFYPVPMGRLDMRPDWVRQIIEMAQTHGESRFQVNSQEDSQHDADPDPDPEV